MPSNIVKTPNELLNLNPEQSLRNILLAIGSFFGHDLAHGVLEIFIFGLNAFINGVFVSSGGFRGSVLLLGASTAHEG